MATVVMTYPRDGGTYGTNADGSLVPFVAIGYVDVPGQVVSVYEDATSALLGSAAASSTPDPSGPWAGWYPWAIPISSWTTSAGALLPAMPGRGAMGAPPLLGTHPILPMAGTGGMADTGYTATSALSVPAMAGKGAVGGIGITAVASLPVMGGKGAADAPSITSGGGSAFSDDFTGTNGSAPNATKWPTTVYSVSADTGASTATIQDNTLALAAQGIDDGEGGYFVNQSNSKRSAWISGVARTTSLDIATYGGGRCYASWLGNDYAADLNGQATRNYLDVFLTSATTYEVWLYNSSGTGTMVGSGSVASGDPYAISLTVPASGDVSLTIKGGAVTLLKNSVPVTTADLGWGSQFKIQVTELTTTGNLTESRFDNVNVT